MIERAFADGATGRRSHRPRTLRPAPVGDVTDRRRHRAGAPRDRRSRRSTATIPTARRSTSSTTCSAVVCRAGLFEEIREQRGLAYSVFSGLACYADTGAWSISTSTQPEHADEVVRLVNAELSASGRRRHHRRRARDRRGLPHRFLRARARGHRLAHGPQRRVAVHAGRDPSRRPIRCSAGWRSIRPRCGE